MAAVTYFVAMPFVRNEEGDLIDSGAPSSDDEIGIDNERKSLVVRLRCGNRLAQFAKGLSHTSSTSPAASKSEPSPLPLKAPVTTEPGNMAPQAKQPLMPQPATYNFQARPPPGPSIPAHANFQNINSAVPHPAPTQTDATNGYADGFSPSHQKNGVIDHPQASALTSEASYSPQRVPPTYATTPNGAAPIPWHSTQAPLTQAQAPRAFPLSNVVHQNQS